MQTLLKQTLQFSRSILRAPVLVGIVAVLTVVAVPLGISVSPASAQTASTFSPAITINVPPVDADGDMVNDFSGARFVVEFELAPVTAGCTSSASATYVVRNSRTAELEGSAATLVDVPVGQTESCSYVVKWPTPTFEGANFTRNSEAASIVRASKNQALADYGTSFTPTINISIPDISDSSSVNVFNGMKLEADFQSISGDDSGCVAIGENEEEIGKDGTINFTVQADGSVSSPITSLVDAKAGGTSRCRYSLELRATAVDESNSNFLVRQLATNESTRKTILTPQSPPASATYERPLYFRPDVNIYVPDIDDDNNGVADYSGTSFSVSYSKADNEDNGCTATASETFEVGTDGEVTRQGAAASLVSYKTDNSGLCRYDATFPESSGNFKKLSKTVTPSTQTGSGELDALKSITVNYASTFLPDVSMEFLNASGSSSGNSNGNLARILVSYTPVPESETNCTQDESEKHIVNHQGIATSSGDRVNLYDRYLKITTVAGKTTTEEQRCQYFAGVKFLTEANNWILKSSTTTLINADNAIAGPSRSVSAIFVNQSSNFPAAPTILVPSGIDSQSLYGNSQFTVVFTKQAGAPEGCSGPVGAIYSLNNSGEFTETLEAISLINTVGESTASCQYNVAANSYNSSLELQNTLGIVNGTSATFTAKFGTFFSPQVAISLLDTSTSSPVGNLAEPNEFSVNFVPVSDAPAGCSMNISQMIQMDDAGMEIVNDSVRLIDRPAGASGRCIYEVSFPGSSGNHSIRPDATAYASATYSKRITGAYFDSTIGFVPTINFNIPNVDANTDGNNDFAGTGLSVAITLKPGASDGCKGSTPASIGYSIGNDGSVSPSGKFVVLPRQDEATICQYELSFPDLSSDGLKRISDAEVDISANSSLASVSYANSFAPSLTVLVPMIDEDDNDVNDLSGTTLTINYNPFSTSDSNCSSGGSETYLIGSSTSASLSGSAVSLIGHIGSVAQECIYDVAFDSLVTDSGKLSNQYRFMPQTKFSSQSASISIATVFSPTLNITVPQFDDNNDGRNDFSGVRFYVYFTPQSGNPPGCTTFESVIYQVRDNGQVTLEGRDAVLVDVPAGQSLGCTYTVHWPPSARGNTLRSSSSGIGVVDSTTSLNIDYTSGVSGGKKK